ncbi:hypothetical protein BGX26_000017 [Mortierella sp. AD094]|nr:hypothetical protein BGX26_000017 [Mortierella sp. AD094]
MMLILSSQEFDPGKGANWIAESETLRVARVINMLKPESTSHIQSHEYLYTLDLPRIHRMLRPIKAKISAIHLAIKSSPSFGYAPINTTTTRDVSDGDFPEDSYVVASRNIKQQYGQSRSLRTRHRGPQNYRGYQQNISTDSPSQQLYPSESTAASGSSTQNGSDTLVRRFRPSLVDLFRDVVEKVWWQPFCEDHDLPLNSTPASIVDAGLAPDSFTLAKSCAFAVGRIVAHIQETDSAQMEKYFNIMPAHMRRFALLEHLVEMCLTQIPIGHLITPLAEVCARYRADYQALRLLKHLSILQDKTFQMDYQWAYRIALEIKKGDAWIAMISLSSPATFFATSIFLSLLRQVQPQHRASLIHVSFDVHMDGSMSSISERAMRSRAIQWTCLLIEDSLRLHERAVELAGTHHAVVMDQCNKVIEHMARCLFETSLRFEGNTRAESKAGLKDVALGLALHSLYIAVTNPSESTGDEKIQEWVQLLETRMVYGIRQLDFDVVVRSYGTLTNLNALALMLDAVGLYALSMKLMSRMLEDFHTLEKNTRKQLGYVCDITVSSLENQLREVEQRRIQHASSDLWRYDDVLGDWVERTPKPNKTALIVFDDDRSDSGYLEDSVTQQTEDHEDFSYDLPLTPPSRSTETFSLGSLPSEYATREFSRHNTTTHSPFLGQSHPATEQSFYQRRQAVESSPFILRKKIRYSMTPIRRPVRSSRQRVYYNDSGSELDEGEEEEEEEEGEEREEEMEDEGTGLEIAAIDSLTPLNDLGGEEEEEENGIDLEPRSSASSRLPYLDDDYVQRSGSNSDDSAQELSDGADGEDWQDADSGISSEGAVEAIVLSDGTDDSSCSYENHDSSGGQDSSIETYSESKQEAKRGRSGGTHAKIRRSRGDDDDYLAPRSARRKKSQDGVHGKQFSAPRKSKHDYNANSSSSKDFVTTEGEGDSRDSIAYQKRQPGRHHSARVRGQLISTHQSESDDDFQPSRKSKVAAEQTARPQRQTQRRAVSPHASHFQEPESSRRALARRAPSSNTTPESNKRISSVIIECLSEDSNNSGVESSDLRRVRGKETHLKSANSAYSLGSESSSESSSGSDYTEIIAKKRIRDNTYYHAAKKIKRTIESEDDTLRGDMGYFDEESDCERNVYAASTSENKEWLEEYGAEDEDGENSDEDGDEEDTMDFCKGESAFSVGAPLPLTEPDELAFWICEPV